MEGVGQVIDREAGMIIIPVGKVLAVVMVEDEETILIITLLNQTIKGLAR